MFANVGWGEMLVLVAAGLIILGPERLPGAIRWTANAVRQAREYLSGATSQLRDELGPEFDDLREPISELQKLRGMGPRAALTKHLLDGDDSVLKAFERPIDLPPDTPSPKPKSAWGPEPVTVADKPDLTKPETAKAESDKPAVTPFDQDAT